MRTFIVVMFAVASLVAGCGGGDTSESDVLKGHSRMQYMQLAETAQKICDESRGFGERKVNVRRIDPILKFQYQDQAANYKDAASKERPTFLPETAPKLNEIERKICR